MGNYIDINDLKQYYQEDDLVRLSRPDGSSETTINETLVNTIIEQAEGMIDGYMRVRYKLPFNPVPQVIKRMTRFLTYFFLMERKFSVNEPLHRTYTNVIQSLKDLQSGKFVLDTDPSDTRFETWKVQDTLQTQGTKEVFSEDNLKGFV